MKKTENPKMRRRTPPPRDDIVSYFVVEISRISQVQSVSKQRKNLAAGTTDFEKNKIVFVSSKFQKTFIF